MRVGPGPSESAHGQSENCGARTLPHNTTDSELCFAQRRRNVSASRPPPNIYENIFASSGVRHFHSRKTVVLPDRKDDRRRMLACFAFLSATADSQVSWPRQWSWKHVSGRTAKCRCSAEGLSIRHVEASECALRQKYSQYFQFEGWENCNCAKGVFAGEF